MAFLCLFHVCFGMFSWSFWKAVSTPPSFPSAEVPKHHNVHCVCVSFHSSARSQTAFPLWDILTGTVENQKLQCFKPTFIAILKVECDWKWLKVWQMKILKYNAFTICAAWSMNCLLLNEQAIFSNMILGTTSLVTLIWGKLCHLQLFFFGFKPDKKGCPQLSNICLNVYIFEGI